MKAIIEPFKIKSVEPILQTTPAEREAWLAEAGYNLFLIDARHILIDPLEVLAPLHRAVPAPRRIGAPYFHTRNSIKMVNWET